MSVIIRQPPGTRGAGQFAEKIQSEAGTEILDVYENKNCLQSRIDRGELINVDLGEVEIWIEREPYEVAGVLGDIEGDEVWSFRHYAELNDGSISIHEIICAQTYPGGYPSDELERLSAPQTTTTIRRIYNTDDIEWIDPSDYYETREERPGYQPGMALSSIKKAMADIHSLNLRSYNQEQCEYAEIQDINVER